MVSARRISGERHCFAATQDAVWSYFIYLVKITTEAIILLGRVKESCFHFQVFFRATDKDLQTPPLV